MHRRLAAIACAAGLAAGIGGSAACAQAPGNDRAAIIASYQSIFGIPRTASAADVVRALGPPTEGPAPRPRGRRPAGASSPRTMTDAAQVWRR